MIVIKMESRGAARWKKMKVHPFVSQPEISEISGQKNNQRAKYSKVTGHLFLVMYAVSRF